MSDVISRFARLGGLIAVAALMGAWTALAPAPAAAASVSGRVTYNGQGLADVQVIIGYQVGSFFKSVPTDGSGAFVLRDIANGTYQVSCSKERYGFLPENLPVTVGGTDVTGLSFTAHDLYATHTVLGRVLMDGAGVPGISLTVTTASGAWVARAMTDASGSYRVAGLNNSNTYVLRPDPSKYNITPDNIRISVKYFDLTGQDFTARLESYRVSGTVALSGQGLEGAAVEFKETVTSTRAAVAMTDGSGRYTATLLGWQSYRVSASKPGYSITPYGTEVGFDRTVPPGTERSGVNFAAIYAALQISGRVLQNGVGLRGVDVRVTPAAGSPLREQLVATDASGNFRADVIPGTYTLTPSHQSYTFLPASQVITVTGESRSASDFFSTLLTYAIRGQVLLNGVGTSGVTVTVSGQTVRTATTDSRGGYEVSGLPTWIYIVTPGRSGLSFTPASREVRLNAADASGVDFAAAGVTYAIKGKTVNAAGVVRQGITVALSGTSSGQQTTDAFGSFTFGGLPSGTYTVTPANAPGYTFKPASRSVTIAGTDATGIDFAEVRPSLRGRVTLNGAGLAGVEIAMMDQPGTRLLISATTDATGAYAFPELEPVSFKLVPARSGYAFSPPQMFGGIFSTSPDVNVDFTASLNVPTYGIAGVVSPSSTAGGVTLSLSGSKTATFTTAPASGYYVFTELKEGTYTVTPNKAGFVFTPASRTVTLSGADQLSLGFNMSTATSTLRGTVREGDVGLSGVTLTLSGAGSKTATTGATGAYLVSGLTDGTYAISPQLAGKTFTPSSRSVTVAGADLAGVDFTASTVVVPRSIRGVVTAGGAGQGGVTVTLAGAETRTTTTDAAGIYAFTALRGGAYSVNASMAPFVYQPSARSYDVRGDVTGADFAAVLHSIRGTILLNNAGLPFVRLSLSGPVARTATTDSAGNFLFSGLPDGSYTVTPSGSGYAFAPASQTVAIAGSGKTGVNFSGSAVAYAIRGQITNPTGGELGATVALTGAASKSAVTDAKGQFAFEGLPNGSYTVTPSKSGTAFTPASRSLTVSGAVVSGLAFTSAPRTYAIRGGIFNGTMGEPGVTVALTGAVSKSATTDGRGNYAFSGLADGSYTVTPEKQGTRFTPASQPATVAGADAVVPKFSAAFVGFSIQGQFVRDLRPLAGVVIGLQDAAGKIVTATTDKLGRFAFSGLKNGTYTVAAAPTLNPMPKSRVVTVLNANVSGVDFK